MKCWQQGLIYFGIAAAKVLGLFFKTADRTNNYVLSLILFTNTIHAATFYISGKQLTVIEERKHTFALFHWKRTFHRTCVYRVFLKIFALCINANRAQLSDRSKVFFLGRGIELFNYRVNNCNEKP
jgi:hypothetical protein